MCTTSNARQQFRVDSKLWLKWVTTTSLLNIGDERTPTYMVLKQFNVTFSAISRRVKECVC